MSDMKKETYLTVDGDEYQCTPIPKGSINNIQYNPRPDITYNTIHIDDSETRFLINGKMHRCPGPALISGNGNKHYYLFGKLINVDRTNRDIKIGLATGSSMTMMYFLMRSFFKK